MSASRILATTATLLLALGVSCFGRAPHTKMVAIDGSYDGREVVLNAGDELDLSLPENPTTGFRWDFAAKAEPVCSIVKSEFKPSEGPPGSGGTHRWLLKAERSGSGKIELEYRRPWEKDKPAARTFHLTIRVR